MRTCNGAIIRGPQVGERLMRKSELGYENIPDPIPCTVVYVNRKHLYYTVQFDAGYRQAYKFGG